eukprot:scaffold10663_cov203-Skeletonema_menzelii.AAC.5
MSNPIQQQATKNENMNEDPKKSPSDEPSARKKKNRPGRSSRRRKHKARSILLEASGGDGDGATEDNNKNQTSSVVPSDRGYTLEGVKIRRRELWLKQHRYDASTINNDDTSSDQQQQNEDEAGTSLDPKDDYQLKAQLGFVPGNAICVAARTSLQEVFISPPDSMDSDTSSVERTSSETSNDHNPSSSPPPAVLKLYPMAIRETYRGGTTDGRKFKARRRGAERPKQRNENNNAEDETKNANNGNEYDDMKKKKKAERRWFIESPVSEEQTADATRIDTPSQDSNNIDDHDEEPERKHIIEPFPTMYWLTSPTLRILISKMELSKNNNVQTMEQRLRSSQAHLDQMERAHKSYGRSRWELLTAQDKESVLQRGWENALDERRGVAGISLVKGRFDCVKCLHAHVAHYLAQVAEWEEEWKDRECVRDDLNLVGKWTMESIETLSMGEEGDTL